jgi:serine protease Do
MTLLAQLSQELEELVARTAPSVVGVEHRRGHGSGVVLAGDGYVLTNAHVIGDAGRLRVRLSGGEETAAERVGSDPRTDLAVLRVATAPLPSLPLATGRLTVGQLVVAIGNPLRFERSVSLGVVSAVDRSLPGREGPYEGLIQTDAAVNPGNSGGPLVNAAGAVVGINTAVIPYAQGLGFAIPAQTVGWVTAVLIHHGEVRRPLLGISARGEDLEPAAALAAGQPRAVRILGIGPESPAQAAGLTEGDRLLRAGATPLGSIDDLQRIMVLSDAAELCLDVLSHGGGRRQVHVRPQRRAA